MSLDFLLYSFPSPFIDPNLPNRIKDRLVNVKIFIARLNNFHKKNRVTREREIYNDVTDASPHR